MGAVYRSLAVLALAATAGCAATPPPPAAITPQAALAAAPARPVGDYLLQPGDELSIKLFYNPELNEHVVVRPDGKISLQLLDDVQAAGLSPSELDANLTERYARKIQNPDVTVIVAKPSPPQVYVGGEVGQPGLIHSDGDLTLLQAVMQSGGFKGTAERRSVLVLRRQPDAPEPLYIVADLQAELTRGAAGNDIRLRGDDIVYVPATQIADVNRFVEQYVVKVIPFTMTLGVFWDESPDR